MNARLNLGLNIGLRPYNFGYAVILSGMAHGLLFWLLPNPLKSSASTAMLKTPTLVRVVALPPTLKKVPIGQTAIAKSEEISKPPEKLAANITEPLSVAPLPGQRPLSTLDLNTPLPKIGMTAPEMDVNSDPSPPSQEVPVQDSPQKSESKSDPKTDPKIDLKPKKNLISKSELSKEETPKDELEKPVPFAKKNAIAKESTESQPNSPSSAASPTSGEAFTATLSSVYQEYGANNIVPRQIAPADALVSPDKREPGIEWIPPAAIATKRIGTVTIVLIVAPNGMVEKELVNQNELPELREIAQQTVKNYYGRFKPIESKWEGKYRFVTIRFDFTDLAG